MIDNKRSFKELISNTENLSVVSDPDFFMTSLFMSVGF